MEKQQVKHKKITILGAARSGLAAAKLLSQMGAQVFVSDLARAENKTEEKHILEGLGIPFEFGMHSRQIYNADVVVLSPGISPKTPVVQGIRDQGIPIFSELEIASWFFPKAIVGITGSNGKTTTTTLAGRILQQKFPDTIVAGNIGTPFSAEIQRNPSAPCAVVEISSFQLETIDSFHPRVAVILNLAPNHLDWYKTYDEYIAAKMRILLNLDHNDTLIYNRDDQLLMKHIQSCPAKKLCFAAADTKADACIHNNAIYISGSRLINLQEIKLRGMHNYMNSMAAGLAAARLGCTHQHLTEVLSTFSGVEHRLEFVAEINGIVFINDSKATTIESLTVALNSFNTPLILIAGGKDKGSDFNRLNTLLKKNVRQAIVIGAARDKINTSWQGVIPLSSADSLADAVQSAFRLARPGDTILLSPACASFDMFRDYEDRGRQFKLEVLKLKESKRDV
jgi:UDP-N-acetylmuramoylalanine--D-glutamate ligase